MTRPSLIIGLGGTGQWVLTFLKKELIERGNGSLPSNVRLLAYDVVTRPRGQDWEDVVPCVGRIVLADGEEYVTLGGNLLALAHEIVAGKHTHLQWFPAKTVLGKYPPGAMNARFGSMFRQLARLCLFHDLAAGSGSRVLVTLQRAIQDLQSEVSRQELLEIIIVSSIAGDTGAGMLVDIASLVRAQAVKLVQRNHSVRGFVVLPSAFGGLGRLHKDRHMLARAFAAWRELDRFMITSEHFGVRQMNYHEQDPELRIQINRRPFDECYLVDAVRATNSLSDLHPEQGVFPTVAQCIDAILDDRVGQAMAEHGMRHYLTGKLARLPRKPYYSAIGSYTLKVPVYYAREKFSHQLALEVLHEFLAPEFNDRGRVMRVSETHNREAPRGHAGRHAALDFLFDISDKLGLSTGKYGTAPKEANQAQLQLFRKLLRAWTVHALNGESQNPLLARGGKIGYARAFYEGLIETCHYLYTVRCGQPARASPRITRSVIRFLKKWRRGRRAYLLAEQWDIEALKDEILPDALADTLEDMQAIAERAREEIDDWIAHLATGDATRNLDGLYHTAAESLAGVNVNHELDKRLDKVSQIVGEHEYRSDPQYIAEALARLKWRVTWDDAGRLQLSCGVEFPAEAPDAEPRYQPFRRAGETPDHHNLDLFLRLTERRYQTLHRDRPLAREIQKVYETGQKLALAVDKMGEPLFMPGATPQGPQVTACYIRVHSDIDEESTAYFREFEAEMKARNPHIKGTTLTLVDSEDPHKVTIVRSDGLLPSADFEMWHTCRQAYIEQVTDPYRGIPAAELHIFPAEINACYYEAEMPGLLGKDYRVLHPEVVALLEDHERFEMFFRSVALGFVREDENRGRSAWIFQLPEREEPIYLTVPKQTIDLQREEDMFQVVHNFSIDGRDQRPGLGQNRQIDWKVLRTAILEEQKELGKTKATEHYRQEIEGPKGMVQRIRDDVEQRRAAVEDEALRATIGQEHEDLADLAHAVYLKAIQSVERWMPEDKSA